MPLKVTKMRKGKLAYILIVLPLLFACNSTKKATISSDQEIESGVIINATKVDESSYTSYLSGREEEVKNAEIGMSVIELTYNPEVVQEVDAISTNVFVAKVISLEKAEGMEGTMPYTYGKLEILSNIKGNSSEIVSFKRMGAVIEVRDFYKGAYESVIEKQNYLRAQSNRPSVEEDHSLIIDFEENDANLNVGSVYLMFATYDATEAVYDILGFEHGSLELEPVSKSVLQRKSSASEWKLIDKTTGKEKKLDQYIEEYLK